MKRCIWLAGVCIILNQQTLANGGGYFRGGVEHAGAISGFEPKETEKIRIVDEKLTIALGRKSANVEIRYLMRNETQKKVKVRFGFPVEESFDWDMGSEPANARTKDLQKLRYCQNYIITASGKQIKSKWQGETTQAADKRFKGISGWLISEVSFTAGEEKPIMIRFDSSYPSEVWDVSDNSSATAALFRYRLSTAACWAGTIGTGRIILKPAGIDPNELRVIKPVNRFKKEGENWVWNFENLEPTLADDLEIEASPRVADHNHTDTTRYVERGSRWLMEHTNYDVSASSFLPPEGELSYEPEKIKNFWGNEAWSEGAEGPGVGEWLQLRPKVAKPLAAIEIIPGMNKSEELFKANARPKKVLVELNGEKRFTAEIPDLKESYRIPIHDYTQAVKKIRITFQEVWPGTRFEDLCVSSIQLQVKLDKKPKLDPVR